MDLEKYLIDNFNNGRDKLTIISNVDSHGNVVIFIKPTYSGQNDQNNVLDFMVVMNRLIPIDGKGPIKPIKR